MIRLRLSEPQASAFECRDWSEEPAVRAAWDGDRTLRFEPEDALQLASEVCDASNAEDAFEQELRRAKQPECAKYAGRAARSLAAVQGRILRALELSRKNPRKGLGLSLR